MTLKPLFVTAGLALLLAIASPASADFDVFYPNGDLGIEVNLGVGLHLAAFWNLSFDGDIFTFQANAVSNPLALSIFGSPAAFAYWFQFLGFDIFGRQVFDLWANQGLGFFFVETVAF